MTRCTGRVLRGTPPSANKRVVGIRYYYRHHYYPLLTHRSRFTKNLPSSTHVLYIYTRARAFLFTAFSAVGHDQDTLPSPLIATHTTITLSLSAFPIHYIYEIGSGPDKVLLASLWGFSLLTSLPLYSPFHRRHRVPLISFVPFLSASRRQKPRRL